MVSAFQMSSHCLIIMSYKASVATGFNPVLMQVGSCCTNGCYHGMSYSMQHIIALAAVYYEVYFCVL